MNKQIDKEMEREEQIVRMTDDGDIIYKAVYECNSIEGFNEGKEILKGNWMRINCTWDCSGQRFTQHMSFFYIPAENKMIYYHFTALDI
jgi:hypothetical protein